MQYLRKLCFSMGRECLRSVILMSEDPQVACPYRDEAYACDCILQEREIRAVRTFIYSFYTLYHFILLICPFVYKTTLLSGISGKIHVDWLEVSVRLSVVLSLCNWDTVRGAGAQLTGDLEQCWSERLLMTLLLAKMTNAVKIHSTESHLYVRVILLSRNYL